MQGSRTSTTTSSRRAAQPRPRAAEQLGLAALNKQPMILDAGLHFSTARLRVEGGSRSTETTSRSAPSRSSACSPASSASRRGQRAVLLNVRLHFINDPSFGISNNITEENFQQNGAISLVRVDPGFIGLATILKPVILDTGVHLIFDPTFEFKAPAASAGLHRGRAGQEYRIQPGMIARDHQRRRSCSTSAYTSSTSRVHPSTTSAARGRGAHHAGAAQHRAAAEGSIVPLLVNGEEHFLLEGVTSSTRAASRSPGARSRPVRVAAARHRIVVPQGRLGLALEQGVPKIYGPGRSTSSTRTCSSTRLDRRAALARGAASLKIITVKGERVGIAYGQRRAQAARDGPARSRRRRTCSRASCQRSADAAHRGGGGHLRWTAWNSGRPRLHPKSSTPAAGHADER